MMGRAMEEIYEEVEQYKHQFFQWRFLEGHEHRRVVALLNDLLVEHGKTALTYVVSQEMR